MGLFNRRNNNNNNNNNEEEEDAQLDHNGTYELNSDDDSIPPPPPPPPELTQTMSSHDIVKMQRDRVSIVSSSKPSSEEFLDNKSYYSGSAENSPFVNGPNSDDINGNPVSRVNDTASKRGGYSSVPITGQFRGMKNAQTFDEEEAGMDEIEVPSSSVVDRWNEWEKKYALRQKLKIVGMIVLGVVVVIIGVSLAGVYGTRAAKNNAGGGNDGNDGNVGEENPGTGGAGGTGATYPDHMNTPSRKVLWDNDLLPASTIVDLEEQAEDSAAYKALQWLDSEANEGYNFDSEDMNDKAKLDVTQRFVVATIANSIEGVEGWMTADDVCDWEGIICGTDGGEGRKRKTIRNRRRKLQEGDEDPLDQYTIKTIALPNSEIKGPIPPEMVLLQGLQNIELFGNFLSGEIPDEIFTLPNLEIFDVFDNELSGTIPAEIGNMKNLIGLYIGRNDFTGKIPVELFTLTDLLALWIDDLQGLDAQPLPSEIASMKNLEQLRISNSQFEGNFPEEIGTMVELSDLRAGDNGFNGEMPDIGALVKLGEF